MEINLTKDADQLICLIYKMYLEKRGLGMSKAAAKNFGGSRTIREQIVPDWAFEDVDDTCRELSRTGMLDVDFGDNIAFGAKLTDRAIFYMENRFKNGLNEVIEFIAKFKPW